MSKTNHLNVVKNDTLKIVLMKKDLKIMIWFQINLMYENNWSKAVVSGRLKTEMKI